MVTRAKKAVILLGAIIVATGVVLAFLGSISPNQEDNVLQHDKKYGIYALDLATSKVALVYATDNEIYTSALQLNNAGTKFVFAMKINGLNESNMEIFTIRTDGTSLSRVTTNNYFDLYPVWSPDDHRIAFLSKRDGDLDIYIANADGQDQHKFYDSGSNDADIDWKDSTIVFTSKSRIWSIKDDGMSPTQITNPSSAGKWGTANLPIGDYDPKLSPDGQRVTFERLENVNSTHGEYNIFVVNVDGTGEVRLTSTSYAQGLPNWSHSSDEIAYVVAAINDEGKYDIYFMKADGSSNHNITPSYLPDSFLCYSPTFSIDDSKIYFIGVWSD